MHFGFVFLALVMVVCVDSDSTPAPLDRTFGSPHTMNHPHGGHQHNHVPGHGHPAIQPGQTVLANDGSFLTVLMCQVVKIPVAGHSAKQDEIPITNSVPPASMASSVITSSQQVLQNITTRVRTAVDRLVDPVVAALQNASLWLNRTSQAQMSNPHPHQQHVHHASVPTHPQKHQNAQRVWTLPAHDHQMLRVIPQGGVPMTVVSVPVLVPAVNVASGIEFNLTAGVPLTSGQGEKSTTQPLTSTSVANTDAAVSSRPTVPAGADDLSGRTFALPTPPATEVPDAPESASLPASTPPALEVTFLTVSDRTIDVSTPAPTASEPTTSEPPTSAPELVSTEAPNNAVATMLFPTDRPVS